MDLIALVEPPIHAHAPHLATWLFTIWASAVALAFLPWAVFALVRRRQPLPILMMVSGMLASLNEPLIDHLGHCWFPRNLPITVFTNFGVHIPLLVIPGYAFVGGVAVFVAYRRLIGGLTRSGVFWLWAALAGADLLLEYPGVIAHVYEYYGPQPFDIFRFPWWWAVVNGTAMLTSAVLLSWLAPRVRGAGRLVVLLVAPTGIIAAYAATAWPTFLALNADIPAWAQWLAVMISGALCLLVVSVIASCEWASAQPADDVLTKELGHVRRVVSVDATAFDARD